MIRAQVIILLGVLAAVQAAPAADGVAAPGDARRPGVADVVQALPEAGRSIEQIAPTGQLYGALKWLVPLTVLSLAPAVVVMVTSFTRIIVVLGLLRQALATQQLPPNQILFGLALLMTSVVMAPVYRKVHAEAIKPYSEGRLNGAEALAAGESHVRGFMIHQIERGGNADEVYLFLDDKLSARDDLKWSDVPTLSLIPAFVVSELKIAFLMGFQIYLPFVIIDMLIASVLISMGMLMLPPVLISLPFKLLLFLVADGWGRVVGALMESFG